MRGRIDLQQFDVLGVVAKIVYCGGWVIDEVSLAQHKLTFAFVPELYPPFEDIHDLKGHLVAMRPRRMAQFSRACDLTAIGTIGRLRQAEVTRDEPVAKLVVGKFSFFR